MRENVSRIQPASPIDQIVNDEIARINKEYVKEAIRLWDIEGRGSFAAWIQSHVVEMWQEMTENN